MYVCARVHLCVCVCFRPLISRTSGLTGAGERGGRRREGEGGRRGERERGREGHRERERTRERERAGQERSGIDRDTAISSTPAVLPTSAVPVQAAVISVWSRFGPAANGANKERWSINGVKAVAESTRLPTRTTGQLRHCFAVIL